MMLSKSLAGEFTRMMPAGLCKIRPTTVSHPGHAHGHVAVATLRAWVQVAKTGVEDLANDASVSGLLKKWHVPCSAVKQAPWQEAKPNDQVYRVAQEHHVL